MSKFDPSVGADADFIAAEEAAESEAEFFRQNRGDIVAVCVAMLINPCLGPSHMGDPEQRRKLVEYGAEIVREIVQRGERP